MGGTSKSEQSQQSTTAPWQAAQPTLTGMLGQVGTGLNNTALTGAETGALNTIENNAGNANRYAPQIGAAATSLLNGGGAQNNDPMLKAAYDRYQTQMMP